MTGSLDVVVAGHLCLDILPDLSGLSPERFRQAFMPGRLLQVGPVSYSTGGPVSNTGLALHKLGLRTRLMSRIGEDLFGQAIQVVLGRHGADLLQGMVVDPQVATSYTVVISPPGIDRFFLHCPASNDAFGPEDVDYAMLSEARIFHFGYPSLMRRMYEAGGAACAEIYRRAKATGVTTSLDMSFPDPNSPAGRADWPSILRAILPSVDVFLPSFEEILFMLRRGTYEELSALAASKNQALTCLATPELLHELGTELFGMGTRIVGLKVGDRGFYLRTGSVGQLRGLGRACPSDLARWADRELWAPCFQVDVVGTLGSGDATIAGFLAGLLNDLSPEEALTSGVAVGACNVETADAISGIRTWHETIARIAQGWPRHRLELIAQGWCFDAGAGLWRHSSL